MPELPEVEVLRRSLEPLLVGDRLEGVVVRHRGLREPVDTRALRRAAAGRRVLALRRRGKYLLVDLEAERTLVVHLGMSGRLTLAPGGAPPEPHEHVAFPLASGRRLRFRDPRRFGLVLALWTATLPGDPHFASLGAEPLDGAFSGETLRRAAAGRRGPVKAFLMDARVVVGAGNIYASEALFRAGVHPERSVARFSPARWQRLAEALVAVLEQAIAEGGTTLNDFTDGSGNVGEFQVSLRVYGREGEGCPRCGRPVRRRVQAGRSTFYCSGCQR
ncbi:MAG TPA: bifunctional DNA-formamidopyrimidine glycosylase/DNA-(apurinic or apyrimidinic site) lyase [Thermoanaerobaculia bacterium]|nr:bifunctional DNA-formamidopyrimidine glycosylase/DNA-(apurinic or apyrimidinic site) lyase [Thermoanaerobaculia bacterium]